MKLALPDAYDEFGVHHLSIRPKPKGSNSLDKRTDGADEDDETVYRMGNQKFGVATIIPPSTGRFTLMQYVSHEDKSLKLPFSLRCKYQKRRSADLANSHLDTYDFQCMFRMSELQDMTTAEEYYPLIQNVNIRFYFPAEVVEAGLVSDFFNTSNGGGDNSGSTPLIQGGLDHSES